MSTNQSVYRVFFYVPNLIGFARIFCSLYSFYIYENQPELFLVKPIHGLIHRHSTSLPLSLMDLMALQQDTSTNPLPLEQY
jgi:hypothetical protein